MTPEQTPDAAATPAVAPITNTSSAVITPALSKDVSFTEKVNDVDTALKSRAAATKDLKLKWAEVIKAFAEFNVQAPARRATPDTIQSFVHKVVVLEPENPLLSDKGMVKLAREASYGLSELRRRPYAMSELENKFPGFTELALKLGVIQDAANDFRTDDKEATKAARAKVQTVIDEYVKAVEAYDDTVESVANVKEYIAIVKDVAEISAIAQGAVAPSK